jgi:hypothetical protein
MNPGTGPDRHEKGSAADPGPRSRLPVVERLGLAFIALVVAILFGAMSLTAWAGCERFLAFRAGIGALMTIWAAAATVRRG